MMNYSRVLQLAVLILLTSPLIAQTPCENGMSDIYPCKNIDMLSRVTAEELLAENTSGIWLNDIWGWTDPDSGKEYALVGMSNGTSFVDVTDPLNPIVLGILPEHESATGRSQANSIWRDVKVFKNHAFVVSEDPNHGMQVFDLSNLRNVQNPPEIFPETAHYNGIKDAHNLAINEATGYAYITGHRDGAICNGGGLHIVDINDPVNPVYAGCFDQFDILTHDAQCIIYSGPDTDYSGQEICVNYNESNITVLNITDKNNPTVISTVTYPGLTYAHQGWFSEDQQYFFSNDEIDELQRGTNTKTFIWDARDLDNPILISTFVHEGSSIDHNLYVKGSLLYQSNYTAGFRILDYRTVESSGLQEVAYFDTFQQDNGQTFNGSWSNYPFFESGNIIVSDITNGLFILKPASFVVTSMNNKELSNRLELYPNPAENHFKLDFSNLSYSKAELKIYDFSGKEVMGSSIDLSIRQEATFDISSLNKGLYNIEVKHENSRITKKLLVNN